MNKPLNTDLTAKAEQIWEDRLFKLNIPGVICEFTEAEAEELGAFEEDALTETDALDASEEVINHSNDED
ncbi:hypothetical protein JQC92_01590 [Shewanella sp. 202IG2-18]|uniref:hypothetical protein n=1 Tax=Parashewanella hymeniacidonis TaxID=2807618 RepID=UPI00195F827E|nr:hypothetical protein [Parashewanella hymeniacidonis]MBM7070736.1 hypothetical protein [Parashewanella hymeniacidonis]